MAQIIDETFKNAEAFDGMAMGLRQGNPVVKMIRTTLEMRPGDEHEQANVYKKLGGKKGLDAELAIGRVIKHNAQLQHTFEDLKKTAALEDKTTYEMLRMLMYK